MESTTGPVPIEKFFTNVIGKDSVDPFPMVDHAWDIYSGKGIRTVFFSIGNSKSAAADLDIAESLGCPIHVVPLNQGQADEWAEVAQILKERARTGGSVFSEGAEKKWILPKNIRVQGTLPWWYDGQIDISGSGISGSGISANGSAIKTREIMATMTDVATSLKLKGSARLDILKIDCSAAPGLERPLLAAVLSAGFRPGIIIVNWSGRPDVELSTTLAAGHLQNSGYRLMSKIDTKFVYYFTDQDMYQICSWEDSTCTNPMLNAIASASKSNEQSKS
jgi:hypothetical protein